MKQCKVIEKEYIEYDDYDRITGVFHDFHCSICGFEFDRCEFCGQSNWINYCPNCGAKITDTVFDNEAGNQSTSEVDKLEKENAELRVRLEKSIELPCEIGGTVWVSVNGGHTFHTAKLYGKNETGAYLVFVDDHVKDLVDAPLNHCFYDWFRVVYTREEAEAKLKEVSHGGKQDIQGCI